MRIFKRDLLKHLLRNSYNYNVEFVPAQEKASLLLLDSLRSFLEELDLKVDKGEKKPDDERYPVDSKKYFHTTFKNKELTISVMNREFIKFRLNDVNFIEYKHYGSNNKWSSWISSGLIFDYDNKQWLTSIPDSNCRMSDDEILVKDALTYLIDIVNNNFYSIKKDY